MMDAIARRKAHRLFGSDSDALFLGKRRPQEDMITSAVFGSIRLMSSSDRCEALALLLGVGYRGAVRPAPDGDIAIRLWPQLPGSVGRRYVEPDVILSGDGWTVIVEVKWHAPLSDRQIEHQIDAARRNGHVVDAVVVLGEAGPHEDISRVPCIRRTWRDVSESVQMRLRAQHDIVPLDVWLRLMRDFLQQTDMGRIFHGIGPPGSDPGDVSYRFHRPGHPPWFQDAPRLVDDVRYRFGAEL